MANTPRYYPKTTVSPESGRPMARGEKLVTRKIGGQILEYRQPGWWCSLDDPNDLDGQLVEEDNLAAEMARRLAMRRRAPLQAKLASPPLDAAESAPLAE